MNRNLFVAINVSSNILSIILFKYYFNQYFYIYFCYNNIYERPSKKTIRYIKRIY